MQNSRKARVGGLAGLHDPAIMDARSATTRRSLRDAVAADPKLKESSATPGTRSRQPETAWQGDLSATTICSKRGARLQQRAVSTSPACWSALADEIAKPNAERLREFRESEPRIAQAAAVLRGADLRRLTRSSSWPTRLSLSWPSSSAPTTTWSRRSWPASRRATGPPSWSSARSCKDVAVRKKLYEGGKKAVDASNDPMIELARLVDPPARAVRKTYENEVDEPQRQAYARSPRPSSPSKAQTPIPTPPSRCGWPSAVVKGYKEDGKKMPVETTFAGLYEHAEAARQQGAVRPADALDRAARTS